MDCAVQLNAIQSHFQAYSRMVLFLRFLPVASAAAVLVLRILPAALLAHKRWQRRHGIFLFLPNRALFNIPDQCTRVLLRLYVSVQTRERLR